MRRLGAVLVVVLVACADKKTPAPAPTTPAPVKETREAKAKARLRDVAMLAARRDPKDDTLATMATNGDLDAIRALGGMGGERPIIVLRALLGHASPEVRAAAVRALWYADAKDAAGEVAKVYDGAKGDVTRALGRLGGAAELPVLATALSDVPDDALISLGLLGRRKIAWGEELRKRVVAGPKGAQAWAVAYALDAEADAKPLPDEIDALTRLAAADDWRARSIAVRALARRGKLSSAALADANVWVRVEAARGMAGPKSTPESRANLAAWAGDEWAAIGDVEERLTSERVHPVLEALALLRAHKDEKPVAAAFQRIHDFTSLGASTEVARYTPGMRRSIDSVNCAAAAVAGKVESCGEPSPDAWTKRSRALLALELAEGTAAAPLIQERNEDPVVQAAQIEAAVRTGHASAQMMAEVALRGGPPLAASSAAEALSTKYKGALPPWAVDALRERLRNDKEGDPEFVLSYIGAAEAAGKSAAAAEPELAAIATDPNQSVRAAVRKALTAVTGKDPGVAAPRGPTKIPPVDPTLGLEPHTLRVKTTKGEFRIVTGVSVWNAATVIALAKKKFYDGTTWHRVVPDFVVQGGDPTGTGSGGPGFDVPAEPSEAPYQRGTVGIADSGKDTGGSQFFVTLSPAPHLEGRYTVIGHVPDEDMAVVDRLQVGDQILTMTVDP